MVGEGSREFYDIFGSNAAHMRIFDWVRHANLNDPTLKSQMLKAGRDPEFQRVQRDVARAGYFNPAARELKKYGLKSERAHAMAFDLSVHLRCGGGMSQELATAAHGGGGQKAILKRLADLGIPTDADANRRHRILNDPHLSMDRTATGRTSEPRSPHPSQPRSPTPALSHPKPVHFNWP